MPDTKTTWLTSRDDNPSPKPGRVLKLMLFDRSGLKSSISDCHYEPQTYPIMARIAFNLF
jgi:hypothetical protein